MESCEGLYLVIAIKVKISSHQSPVTSVNLCLRLVQENDFRILQQLELITDYITTYRSLSSTLQHSSQVENLNKSDLFHL